MERVNTTSRLTTGVLLAIALQVLDLVSFQIAIQSFSGTEVLQLESNTLMGILYLRGGFLGLLLAKSVLVGYLLMILPYLNKTRGIAVAAVGAIGLLGTLSNLLIMAAYS